MDFQDIILKEILENREFDSKPLWRVPISQEEKRHIWHYLVTLTSFPQKEGYIPPIEPN